MLTILQNFSDLLSAHLSETAKHWDSFLSLLYSTLTNSDCIIILKKPTHSDFDIDTFKNAILKLVQPRFDNIKT